MATTLSFNTPISEIKLARLPAAIVDIYFILVHREIVPLKRSECSEIFTTSECSPLFTSLSRQPPIAAGHVGTHRPRLPWWGHIVSALESVTQNSWQRRARVSGPGSQSGPAPARGQQVPQHGAGGGGRCRETGTLLLPGPGRQKTILWWNGNAGPGIHLDYFRLLFSDSSLQVIH